MSLRCYTIVLILCITVPFIIPPAAYWHYIGKAPYKKPFAALRLLDRPGSQWKLIDVNTRKKYLDSHIVGSINWPVNNIETLSGRSQMPENMQQGHLLLICTNGFLSARAVLKLRELGLPEVYNVRGGQTAWISTICSEDESTYCMLQGDGRDPEAIPFLTIPLFEQLTAALAAFMIKPLYMIISGILIFLIWGVKERDLVFFRWALIFFLTGEAFCAINYLLFNEDSYMAEYIHIYGMVLAMGFTVLALAESADKRILHVTEMNKKCAVLGLCKSCYKYSDITCRIKQSFSYMIPIFIILSFIPLTADIHPVSYNIDILGTKYNYTHPALYQIFEIRLLPLFAILFFILSFIFVQCREQSMEKSKLFFSMAAGFLGFSFFRLILLNLYRQSMTWFIAWEEITELLFVAGASAVLWIFRENLLQEKSGRRDS